MLKRLALVISVIAAMTILLITNVTGDARSDKGPTSMKTRISGFGTALEVSGVVSAWYVDPISRVGLLSKYMKTGTIEGMLESIGDPYTRYMKPKAWEELKEETKGSFQGIGVIIGLKDKHVIVVSPIDGTPGFRAGLLPGDRIIKIGKSSTEGMTTQQAADRMRGPKGTVVKISVLRGSGKAESRLEMSITRDDIKLDSVSAQPLEEDPRIGYVRISSFSETTSEEFTKALGKLYKSHVKGLILDLRYNPGGLLTEAMGVCGEFLKPGTPVLHVQGRTEKATYRASSSNGAWGAYPTVILTNEGTASASEIVTGALQDYKLATVVGTKTFGKGLIQNVVPLAHGGGVTVTTARYLTAKRRAINLIGITPDVTVKLPNLSKDKKGRPTKEEFVDTQLKAAVEIVGDKITRQERKQIPHGTPDAA